MITIGEKIKELRKAKKISQEDLSFELGVSRQTIHKWESDAMQPNTENLKSLCDYFKVSSTYFLSDNDKSVIGEAAVADDKRKTKRYLIVCSVIMAIAVLALIVALAFTVGIGLIVFSVNHGFLKTSMLVVDASLFYLFLALSSVLLAINIVMVFFIKKR